MFDRQSCKVALNKETVPDLSSWTIQEEEKGGQKRANQNDDASFDVVRAEESESDQHSLPARLASSLRPSERQYSHTSGIAGGVDSDTRGSRRGPDMPPL
jgi:hypothetical protein